MGGGVGFARDPEVLSVGVGDLGLELCHEWQMIGRRQRYTTPVQTQALKRKLLVVIEMVEMKERNKSRIGTRTTQKLSRLGRFKSISHQAGSQSTRPLIKIPQQLF